jgi:hypothetical protein
MWNLTAEVHIMRVIAFRPLLVAAFVVGGGNAAFAHGAGAGLAMHSFAASPSHSSISREVIDPPPSSSLVGLQGLSPSSIPTAGLASEEAATARLPAPSIGIDPSTEANDSITTFNGSDVSGATTQSLPGSSAGQQVPVYNTSQLSTPGLSQSINQASQDSGATSCNGLGQRNSTIGNGSSSQIDSCSTSGGGLSTMSIMTTSSGLGRPINVGGTP